MSTSREKCREKRDPKSKSQVPLTFKGQGGERELGKGDKKVQPETSQDKQESTVSGQARDKMVSKEKEASNLTPALRLFLESLL